MLGTYLVGQSGPEMVTPSAAECNLRRRRALRLAQLWSWISFALSLTALGVAVWAKVEGQ